MGLSPYRPLETTPCSCCPSSTPTNYTPDPNEKRFITILRAGDPNRIHNALQSMNSIDFIFQYTDSLSCTPIHYAARFLSAQCLHILWTHLQRSQHIHTHTLRDQDGATALHQAIVRFGTLFDAPEDEKDLTNKHNSEVHTAYAVVQYLCVNRVCDTNATDNYGRTAFYLAVVRNLIWVCKFLVTHAHANPHIKDVSGKSPLHVCWTVTMAQYLIHGVHMDPQQTDLQGLTPLHSAARNNHQEVCAFLADQCQVNVEELDVVSHSYISTRLNIL